MNPYRDTYHAVLAGMEKAIAAGTWIASKEELDATIEALAELARRAAELDGRSQ